MNETIREQAELLGFQITNWDIEQIKDKYFHLVVTQKISNIRSAIKVYFQ